MSPTARRFLAVALLLAAFAAVRGPLHRVTWAQPVSNDDAILLLMGRHVLQGELATTLCDHAVGNYRVLTGMAAELLATAAQRELTQLDEKLFLELYGTTPSKPRKIA